MATLLCLSRLVSPFSRNFRNVTRSYSSLRRDKTFGSVKTGVVLLFGGSIAYFLVQRYNHSNVVHALKARKRDEDSKSIRLTMREKRFIKFASVEFDGQLYMTPQDFLESIVESEPRPRLKRRCLSEKELEVMKNAVPTLRQSSPHMFRNLRDKGIISYTEYLFLLSILTKPKTGFQIAFNMFDTDGNERVDKTEFLVLHRILSTSEEAFVLNVKLREPEVKSKERIVSNSYMETIFSHAWRGRQGMDSKHDLKTTAHVDDDQGLQRRHGTDTTLMIHFFGKDGTHELRYDDFRRFMENLQHEVLELEFHEFSKGHDTISELDFAKILLRYTYLDTDEYDKYLDRIIDRSDLHIGITFDEFRHFYQFLNNLDDFSIAMRMYTLADHPISKDEFRRAVKICTGTTLSQHIVDTVFVLFDEDGDEQLSYKEFIAIMKDRLTRGMKSQQRNEGWEAFKYCVKQEMKAP
ncbi:calcium uptake protein 3, mitochondrial isoform X2 [Prorops nasuta]|uniref:calcium uptake protein 3, mitochondrial isoform X2 n=1 Tax=Prorops nasuta TaxID=863751 RepID=UPI0034CDCCDC